MNPIFIFVLVLIFGYILTSLIVNNFLSKYYTPIGIEYIFLGIILGPAFTNWIQTTFDFEYPTLISRDFLLQLEPGVAAVIGFIGLTYGLKFNLKKIVKLEKEHLRLVFTDILFGLLMLGGISFALLYFFFYKGNNLTEIATASAALSLMGIAVSPSLIRSVIEKYNSAGKITDTLTSVSEVIVNISILLFGLLFGIVHIGANPRFEMSPVEWIVSGLMLSVIIGLLFFIFLGREKDENKFIAAVTGIAIFTSGIAYSINFSPLYMNFILGLILANFSSVYKKMEHALSRYLMRFEVLIIIIAGFYWIPPGQNVFFIAVAAFLIIRYIYKMLGGYFAYSSSYDKDQLVPSIGKGINSHGIIAAVMVIDYMSVYKNEFTAIVVSCILTSILIFELISIITTTDLLVDSGEIRKVKS